MELVKREEGFYVPREYEYYNDTGKRMPENHEEDCYANPPKISFNEKVNKWELRFDSADSGGYDVQDFHYYFDDLNDILEFMCFPLCCNCIK